MTNKKKGLEDIEVECGGAWKRVVKNLTYGKDGKRGHKLEQGHYGTDNDGDLKEESPRIGTNIDLSQ